MRIHYRRKTANVFFIGSSNCSTKHETSRESCASTIWWWWSFRSEKEGNTSILRPLSASIFMINSKYKIDNANYTASLIINIIRGNTSSCYIRFIIYFYFSDEEQSDLKTQPLFHFLINL
jgi:hypothetical protein